MLDQTFIELNISIKLKMRRERERERQRETEREAFQHIDPRVMKCSEGGNHIQDNLLKCEEYVIGLRVLPFIYREQCAYS